MKKKGLCVNCANRNKCVLPKKLPVFQCEEHTVNELAHARTEKQAERK